MAEGDLGRGLEDLEAGPAAADAREAPRGEGADAASHPTVAALRTRFGDAVLHHTVMAGDEHVVYIPAQRVREVLGWLRDDPDERYVHLADVTAVDYGAGRPLEVVYQLWSVENRRALRIKATLPLDALEVDSVEPLWHGANWLERETFDMFGIHFRGHPDLRRILMPENYAEGHPLRKDFPLRGRFSRAEQTRRALAMEVEEYYTPQELGIATRVEADAARGEDAGRASGEPVDAAERAGRQGRPGAADRWSPGAPDAGAGGAPAPGGVES